MHMYTGSSHIDRRIAAFEMPAKPDIGEYVNHQQYGTANSDGNDIRNKVAQCAQFAADSPQREGNGPIAQAGVAFA